MNNQIFQDVESMVRPIIKSNANKFYNKLNIAVDDAEQEARIAVLNALENYDYNESKGGIYNFISTSVRNHFLREVFSSNAQFRSPHLICEVDGKREIVRGSISGIDSISLGDFADVCRNMKIVSQDDRMEAEQEESRIAEIALRLTNNLGAREKLVFECKINPPFELLQLMMDDCSEEPTITLIAKFLKISKNSIDFSLSKIRRMFVAIVESDDFSDIAEKLVVPGCWPMIFSCDGESQDFVRKVIEERSLDQNLIDRKVSACLRGHRVVETYEWGAVVFASYEKEIKTLVVEGRFNARKGSVHTKNGAWKSVEDTIPWYKDLSAELAA